MRRHLFAVTSVILLLFLIVAMTRYELLKFRVAFADDQISIFREMRRSAGNTSDPHEIAGFLSYTVTYYPSGTKQLMGSALDRMVEAARSDAVAAILVRFRSVTQ